jgi:hypothetical protein
LDGLGVGESGAAEILPFPSSSHLPAAKATAILISKNSNAHMAGLQKTVIREGQSQKVRMATTITRVRFGKQRDLDLPDVPGKTIARKNESSKVSARVRQLRHQDPAG